MIREDSGRAVVGPSHLDEDDNDRTVRMAAPTERPILSTVESSSGGVGKWIFRLVLAAVVVGIIYGVATGWLS
jgi:hypothetical protein